MGARKERKARKEDGSVRGAKEWWIIDSSPQSGSYKETVPAYD